MSKLDWALFRNFVLLAYPFRRTRRRLTGHLATIGFKPHRVEYCIGLIDQISYQVIFRNDTEFTKFHSRKLNSEIQEWVRSELNSTWCPKAIAQTADVSFHSQQEIDRAGGDWLYFN